MGVGAVTAGVAFAGILIGQWGGYPVAKTVADYGLLVFAVFAAGCSALAAASAEGRQRRAWICLTVGLAGWAGGEALWMFYERVLHQAPFPSLADAGYLLFPVGAGLAMVLFPIGYSGHSRVRFLLDGFIVAGALFEISWVLVMRGVYDAGGTSAFALALSLAYPIADIAILTVALLVLARARTGRRTTLAMLSAGVVMMALSDSAFAYLTAHDAYYSGHVIDIGWAIGLLLFGMAALINRRAREDRCRRFACAVSRDDVAAVRAGGVGRTHLLPRVLPDAWPRPDPRVIDTADGRGDGQAVHGGAAEPATAEDGGRPGDARHAHRPGQSRPVQRPADARGTAAPERQPVGGRAVDGPR